MVPISSNIYSAEAVVFDNKGLFDLQQRLAAKKAALLRRTSQDERRVRIEIKVLEPPVISGIDSDSFTRTAFSPEATNKK